MRGQNGTEFRQPCFCRPRIEMGRSQDEDALDLLGKELFRLVNLTELPLDFNHMIHARETPDRPECSKLKAVGKPYLHSAEEDCEGTIASPPFAGTGVCCFARAS